MYNDIYFILKNFQKGFDKEISISLVVARLLKAQKNLIINKLLLNYLT